MSGPNTSFHGSGFNSPCSSGSVGLSSLLGGGYSSHAAGLYFHDFLDDFQKFL